MIDDHIRKIEARLQNAGQFSETTRKELLELLETLRSEVAALPETHREEAGSIARFAEASTHEATRADAKPRLLGAAIDGLTGSVEEFEVTHPQLTATINRMAMILSNMGI